MIKVGITGAEKPIAGELVRILINHPEVEIRALYSPEYSGRSMQSIHHGMIGEKIIKISDKLDFDNLDIIFIVENYPEIASIPQLLEKYPEMRIVDLTGSHLGGEEIENIEYGLSEINRKALVRGARAAVIPSATASLILMGLYPLAFSQLIDGKIEVEVAAPRDIVQNFDSLKTSEELNKQIRKIDNSFSGDFNIKISPNKSERVIRVKLTLSSPLSLDEIEKLFKELYDDHNFVFTSMSEIEGREVEGTQKSVITIDKPDNDTLVLDIVGDCRLRGGAGDAIHVMNLFFALYEKIGLTLKPSRYGLDMESTSRASTWVG